jgi:hypothetical protein
MSLHCTVQKFTFQVANFRCPSSLESRLMRAKLNCSKNLPGTCGLKWLQIHACDDGVR